MTDRLVGRLGPVVLLESVSHHHLRVLDALRNALDKVVGFALVEVDRVGVDVGVEGLGRDGRRCDTWWPVHVDWLGLVGRGGGAS